jgi:hypothetical protein
MTRRRIIALFAVPIGIVLAVLAVVLATSADRGSAAPAAPATSSRLSDTVDIDGWGTGRYFELHGYGCIVVKTGQGAGLWCDATPRWAGDTDGPGPRPTPSPASPPARAA